MTKKKKNKDWRLQKNYFLKFWYYIWYDESLLSYVVNFIVAFIFIKYLLFPGLGLALGNDYPIVAIVTGSMQHKIVDNQVCGNTIADISSSSLSYEQWFEICGSYYEKNFGITNDQFSFFDYPNGLNIGDVLILKGVEPREDLEVGDTLVFYPDMRCAGAPPGPMIHRIVDIYEENSELFFTTKGDYNPVVWECMERKISEDRVIGEAVVRIPFLGYFKVLLNEVFMSIRG